MTKPTKKILELRPKPGVQTIPDMVEISAETHKDRIAFLTPRKGELYKISYGRVLEYVKRLGRYLKELGLGKGDHIAILGENRPEWAISYLAVTWIGAIAIPLDARASSAFYKHVLNFSTAKAIILSSSYIPHIHQIQDEVNTLKHIILMENLEDIYGKYEKGTDKERVLPDELAEILFTSGTTGTPRGVMLTHRNIMSNVEDIYSITELNPEDRTFSILPLHHSYECTAGFLSPFYNGMSIFYARSLKPNEMIEDLKISKPTLWLTAPLILEKLYRRIEKELSNQHGLNRFLTKALPERILGYRIKQALGLERIRLIVCGGAALGSRVSEGLEKLGFPLIQGYGLSEAAPIVSVNPPAKPKNESVGMIIPSDEVEIRNPDSEGNGEIAVKGPNIMKGYFKDPESTKEVLTPDGWLLTGDIGYFDEEGYLYITGRKKSVIVTKGGKNVFPEEIEEKLTQSVYIEEAFVFSPDDENIQALVYPNLDEVRKKLEHLGKEPNDDNVWELIKAEVRKANEKLEIYKRIRHFAIVYEELPKTTTRKLRRYELRNITLSPETRVFRKY